jgi:hypothetical protein
MAAVRKRAFNGSSKWRNGAYAALNINWKQMYPDLSEADSREERLAWICEYLGLKNLRSTTDLSDEQLGSVVGEMKRLTGHGAGDRSVAVVRKPRLQGNVVRADFGRSDDTPIDDGEVVHLASREQVYTLDKLQTHLGWAQRDVFEFIRKRVLRGKARLSGSVPAFHMLTFRQATTAVNALLHVAGHRDLKTRNGGKPVSRKDLDKYIPILKRELKIDQIKQGHAVKGGMQ